VETARIVLMTTGKMKQDTEVGSHVISLGALQSHVEVQGVYPMVRPDDDKFKSDTKERKIKLRYTLEYELILPIIVRRHARTSTSANCI
jgi:hypothetical protein